MDFTITEMYLVIPTYQGDPQVVNLVSPWQAAKMEGHSKVVSTHLWNTPRATSTNKAIQGFLS